MDELYKIKDDETRVSIMKYLSKNGANIKWDVFKIIYPGFNDKYYFQKELVLNKDLFIKALPLFMYNINSNYPFRRYLPTSRFFHSDLNLIEYIQLISELYYKYSVEIPDIFDYPTTQQSDDKFDIDNTIKVLKRWINYLDIKNGAGNSSYEVSPKNLIVTYNDLLVAQGRDSEIFYVTEGRYGLIDGKIVLKGCIPVDDEGKIRMEYIGIYVDNVDQINAHVDKGMEGYLQIIVNSKTTIKILEKKSRDTWKTIYKGEDLIAWAGKRFDKIRQELGMTQKQLADSLGVTVSSIYNWTYGICAPDAVKCEKIRRICNKNGVHFDMFDD